MSEQFSDRCPNCGWSDADEQDFLEHQSNFPEPPRWKRIIRWIYSQFFFADFYWFFIIGSLIGAFDELLQSQGIEAGLTTLHYFIVSAIFLSPVIVCRAVYSLLQYYAEKREFEELFNNDTTTTPQPEDKNHA